MVSPDCFWYLRCAHLVGLNGGQPRMKSSLYNLAIGASADIFLEHVATARDAADYDAARWSCGYPDVR